MHGIIQEIRWPLMRRRATVRALLTWASLLGLVAGAAAPLGPSGAWSAEPEIVARVNGEPVTRGEMQRLLADPLVHRQLQWELGVRGQDRKAWERLAVQKLIHRQLILQEARRREVTVTREDLSQATTALRRHFKDLKSFGAYLQARGLDDQSLQEMLRNDILMTRVRDALVKEVRVTEKQVQEYYAGHKAELKTAEAVRLRVIAVQDKKAADEIMAAVRKGEDFARLAQERSKGSHAAQGGDMGWVSPRTLPSPLRETVGTLKAGETRGPLQSGTAFLLVRVEDRRPAQPMSLAEARPEIERRLLAAQQQEMLQAWATEQEKKAKIEVFL